MHQIVLRQRGPVAMPVLGSALFDALLSPSRPGSRSVPLELFETNEAFVLRAALPGFSKEGVRVDIDKATVSILAEREEAAPPQGASALMRSEGFSASKVSRVLELPEAVDSDRAQAKFDQGILEMTLPKLAPTKRSLRIE